MSTPGEFEPTTDTNRDGAGAGAMGGDSAGDSTLPPPIQQHTEEPGRRSRWPGSARPKTKGPYTQLPQHEDIPLKTYPFTERSGLPSVSKGTAETTFIKAETTASGRVLSLSEKAVIPEVEEDFPLMDPDEIQLRYKGNIKRKKSHHRGQNGKER